MLEVSENVVVSPIHNRLAVQTARDRLEQVFDELTELTVRIHVIRSIALQKQKTLVSITTS